MSIKVGIFLFEEIEALDFAGPYEVFTTASRVADRLHPGSYPLFSVFSVAENPELVRVRAGMKVEPDFIFSNTPPIDLLLVPGGVVTAQMQNDEALSWIRKTSGDAQITASICTGVFLLAQAGIVTNHKVTTHREDIADLRQLFPTLNVVENVRWQDEGQLLSSAGISAGIDMSLHLVERLASRELALATARQMEFDWS